MIIFFKETKDESCCLRARDEDDAIFFDNFGMKGTVVDDIAKVIPKDTPIIVLGE